MKQITLSLVKNTLRPIVQLNNWNNFRALLDTGAYFPIWTADERILIELGEEHIRDNVCFGVFGGTTAGNLYSVTTVVGSLVYPNMHIIACKDLENVPFNLILSATMFQHLIYEIDDKNYRFNITVPDGESMVRNLRIEDSNGKIYVLCSSASDGD